MKKRINLLREFSIPLIAGVVVALLWANIAPDSYNHLNHAPLIGSLSFHFITNELFMVFFFGIAAVEITQSCLPGGDLSPPGKAVNPLLATLGGILGPVIVYFALNHFIGSEALHNGWGIPTATDIALAWLVARLVFGDNHPVIAFLLLLAIADDAIGLAIIAIFYPDPAHPVAPIWLLLTGAGMAAAYILRRYGMKNYWPYIVLGGIPSWTGLHAAHLHPALALVFIVPFLPHPMRETKHIFEEDPADVSTLASFEHEWKIIVDFGMFMFGLANAGVEVTAVGTATWLVFVSLLVGKTAGIFSMGYLGEKLGFPLPNAMGYKELMVAGLIAGIGFTVALFVAGEAFASPAIQGAAKMGAMLSILAFPLAIILSRILKIRKVV
ncbi:MAG TPA: Na+/H+ antiporter NhaA [Geobacteraceae bacterium]|nr:Na+/H+ antiporter NhaA [Geobacteraceae bacterium]